MEILAVLFIFFVAFLLIRRSYNAAVEANARSKQAIKPITKSKISKIPPKIHQQKSNAHKDRANVFTHVEPSKKLPVGMYGNQYGDRVGKIDLRHGKSSEYKTIRIGKPSRGTNFIKNYNLKNMVIASEIFGKPKALK